MTDQDNHAHMAAVLTAMANRALNAMADRALAPGRLKKRCASIRRGKDESRPPATDTQQLELPFAEKGRAP